MVERVSWFSPVDYEIFLFFDDHDIKATAKVIGANIDYDRQYVHKRLRKLTEVDLLESEDGLYQLSQTGRRFVNGEIDASELEDIND